MFTQIKSSHSERPATTSNALIAKALLGLGMIGSLVIGCGFDSESLSAIEQAARQQTQIAASFDDASVSSVSHRAGSNHAFQPAFPQRRDPFRVNENDVVQDEVLSVSSDLRVIGFAKMGEQQAILKIGDDSKFVVVGDKVGDVEILSISPPRVRMRSGNLIWDASMFQNQALGSSSSIQD